jgi:hypothetical protein
MGARTAPEVSLAGGLSVELCLVHLAHTELFGDGRRDVVEQDLHEAVRADDLGVLWIDGEANLSAAPRPKPLDAPVMTKTFPRRSGFPMMFLSGASLTRRRDGALPLMAARPVPLHLPRAGRVRAVSPCRNSLQAQ